MKEKKILQALGQVDTQYIKEAEPMENTKKKSSWQKWGAIAACFTLIAIIGIGIFHGRMFGKETDTAVLKNGEKITFVKSNQPTGSIDLDVIIKPLNTAEIQKLFADLPVTANAYLDTDHHKVIGFEGRMDDVKLIVSTSGAKLLDRVIQGSASTSTVGNTSVTAGYFVTHANNQGMKTVIYYASFDIGENSVYVEYSGTENERETIKNKVADTILKLIENGAFDLSQIQA